MKPVRSFLVVAVPDLFFLRRVAFIGFPAALRSTAQSQNTAPQLTATCTSKHKNPVRFFSRTGFAYIEEYAA